MISTVTPFEVQNLSLENWEQIHDMKEWTSKGRKFQKGQYVALINVGLQTRYNYIFKNLSKGCGAEKNQTPTYLVTQQMYVLALRFHILI